MTHYQTATEAMPDFAAVEWFDCFAKVREASFSMASGYLNALTALMLGLDVSYFRSQKSAGVTAAHFARRFQLPEFYSVTSTTTAHYFWSSASVVSSALSAAHLTQDKMLAKPVLAKAGVRTPAGGPANAANMTVLDQLQAARVTRVVVKPAKGSAARGVAANVTLDEARAYIRFKPNEMFVVEQYINGTEVRATMVGGLLCSAVQREPCFVVGDGLATIEDLVARKVDSFLQNPRAAVQKYKLSDFASYLRQQGRSFADVPAIGERVRLRGAHPVTGDERNDVTATVHRDVVVQATNAMRAFQLGVGAVDTITSASGQTFVLELNAKPAVDATVFPNEGAPNLRVPEAIMRWHFPQHPVVIRRVKQFDFVQLWNDYEMQTERDEFNARDYVDFD